MKIQYLNGGLANQVFQYIFARYMELSNPIEKVYLDDSFFFANDVHNGYELEKVFGIKANLLSEYFTPDVWQAMIEYKRAGSSICQIFEDMGEKMLMVTESDNYPSHNPFNGEIKLFPCNQFIPELAFLDGNIYYHGYWINKNYLNAFREEIMAELVFPPLSDPQNLQIADHISECESVAVHVRRGDYVSLNWQLGEAFYKDAAEKIMTEHPDAVFFVFSDDPDWCRANAESLGLNLAKETIFVEGNMQGKNYIDLQLMTMCKGMILSNSAFCYLAALMNTGLEYYINPVDFREI